jgi:uncharacterized protein
MVTAFEGTRRIASGTLPEVVQAAKPIVDRGRKPVLIFDDRTSEQVEVDFRGSVEEAVARVVPAQEPSAGPGRPRLGVVGREVTLLPRHWEWLNSQPGGASVALRKLVEDARKGNEQADRMREARESAYRFLSAMAGNLSGFEEATRALFAGNRKKFKRQMEDWPEDIREHSLRVAAEGFEKK